MNSTSIFRRPSTGHAATRLVLILLTLILAGCAGLSSSSNAPGLRDAMREAGQGSSGGSTSGSSDSSRSDASECESDSTDVTVIESILSLIMGSGNDSSSDAVDARARPAADPFIGPEAHRNWLMLGAGTGLVRTELLDDIRRVDLRFGIGVSERVRLDLAGGIGRAPVSPEGPIARSLADDPMLVSAGAGVAVHLTPRHTLFGFSLLASVGLDRMSWSYSNPVTLTSTPVYDDVLYGLELSAGAGIALLRRSWMELTAEVAPGMILWYPSTEGGFRNDLFEPTGYLRVGVMVGFGM